MSRNTMLSSQLGMPISTARSRLVKMLMFRELQHSSRDDCYRCGLKIDDIDHLSIEHKLPWLHVNPELFWDLDNVAFSHLSCNSSDARPNGGLRARKIGPDGTSWCYYGKHFVGVERFDVGPRFNGLAIRCKPCNNQSKKDYKIDRKKI